MAVASGAALTEYYLAPRYFSNLLSKWICRQKQGQLLRLNQTITPETATKTYLVKNDVASFSEADSNSLAATIQLENISDIQLENVRLQHYGLEGFKFSNALLGSPDIPEEKYSAISPSYESKDKVEFNLPNLPYGKKAMLKLVYTPQPDAMDSTSIAEGTARYYDEGWPNIQKPIDLCERYYDASSTARTTVKVKDVKLQLIDIELQLFHDYHGDGAKQDDEPVITDAVFDVRDDKGIKVLTGIDGNGNGIYRLDDLKEGENYRLEFSNETSRKYRHIAISNDEFLSIDNYEFMASPNKKKIELGLMNGFLTLPFEKGTYYHVSYYVDRGEGIGWEGHMSYRGHSGTDFQIYSGTKIVASAPGKIIATEFDWPRNPKTGGLAVGGRFPIGNYVAMDFDNGMRVLCGHLSKSLVNSVKFPDPFGQRVRRGEAIALSGSSGVLRPHVHFQLMYSNSTTEWSFGIDPFGEYSAWTKDNDPQFPITKE